MMFAPHTRRENIETRSVPVTREKEREVDGGGVEKEEGESWAVQKKPRQLVTHTPDRSTIPVCVCFFYGVACCCVISYISP